LLHQNVWGTPGKASVLVGGQFGSEGKGLAAAWLAVHGPAVDIATTNAGAQAGHTTRFRDGRGFVCFHLPTTGVIQKGNCQSYINAGSIIDQTSLRHEIEATGVDKVVIHPRAALILDEHRNEERAAASSTSKIASTQKGVGAAISGKVMRRGALAELLREVVPAYEVRAINLNDAMRLGGASVVAEVPQGTDLSLNHGLAYPYTTSRDCWVGSGISDAGIHPWFVGPVCMVVRTFPIRVGHLYNEHGELLGESGPFYSDSRELSWNNHFPGIEPERTTVTKRVRRIASWSNEQYAHAIRLNRPTVVFLNFCNYLERETDLFLLRQKMRRAEVDAGLPLPKHVFGFGPCVEDVTDDYAAAMAWYDKRTF
jgi:adenylosuccinate synthase